MIHPIGCSRATHTPPGMFSRAGSSSDYVGKVRDRICGQNLGDDWCRCVQFMSHPLTSSASNSLTGKENQAGNSNEGEKESDELEETNEKRFDDDGSLTGAS